MKRIISFLLIMTMLLSALSGFQTGFGRISTAQAESVNDNAKSLRAGELDVTEKPVKEATESPLPDLPANLFTKQTEGGQVSLNRSKHNYYNWQGNWSEDVTSYLEQKKDGTYERVEACEDGVYVEQYSEDFTFVRSQKLEMPLPLFGGYFSGKKYNFLVFGQENPNENDSLEVLRVIKYDKDWNELVSSSISGINTCIPFDAGSLRMTETDGVLYIHTCHIMYASSDGLNHQANMTFAIDQESMNTTQSQYSVRNISRGYVSHSFNQFIVTNGAYIYRLDHGDAYPRSVVVTKCSKDNISSATNATVLSMGGEKGDNYTGVCVGGFSLKRSKLVTVGNSVEEPGVFNAQNIQRNIFVAVTDTGFTGTSLTWLTDYGKEGKYADLGNPHLISCDDGYYVIWEEKSAGEYKTKVVKIDIAGRKIGETYTVNAPLSDCQPILNSDNQLVWYTTSQSAPTFFCLETDKFPKSEYTGKGNVMDCVVTLEQDSYEYSSNTSPYKPIPTVEYEDARLEEGRDYTVSYHNNSYPGTGTVTITGIGSFEGAKNVTFNIVDPQSDTIAPSHTAKPSKTTTAQSKTKTTYPGKVSGVKAKNVSKKSLKITWKKAKNAHYYEVQIAKNRAFTKGKKRYASYLRKMTVFMLKKNTTYYVRIRAVHYSNGKNRYSKWSAVKKAKIRK